VALSGNPGGYRRHSARGTILLGTTQARARPVYVREKTIPRGDKTYSYYQLVEGERVDGRVRQKVVKHLGRLPSREHADMAARRLGFLCSVLECGRQGTQERRNPRVKLKLCAEHAAMWDDGEPLLVYPLF
jgi:hypothetical protein